MPTLPALEADKMINHSPHVVILGAGASIAAFPEGDGYGKRLPQMKNLAELTGLSADLKSIGVKSEEDFEEIYDTIVTEGRYPEIVNEMESKIFRYFKGLDLPADATLYDLLLLSLREKDLIASFNWDPFLAKAYRRNRHIKKLPKIVFLHGNVDIGICREHRTVGFIEQGCSICRKFEQSKLLYPVKHKNYTSDPFINDQWNIFKHYLNKAYFVTIFGYRAPTSDVEAKKAMLETWQTNPTLELAEIEIIGISPRNEIERRWKDFLYSHHYGICKNIFESYLFMHPRRSCDAFAMATLQCDPWNANNLPNFKDLGDLHEWIKPLLAEEEKGVFSGKPISSY